MPAADQYNATITDRSDLTDSLAFFRVRTDDGPHPFRPGQYLTLGLRRGDALVQRPYSIASSAHRTYEGYELYVRRIPNGALTPLLFERQPGDRVAMRYPKGRFTLGFGDPRVHLFVATGCGIAPFVSILRTLRDEQATMPIVLVHGVSYARELAYRLFLEDLASEPTRKLTYVPTVSRPSEPQNAGWSGEVGRVEDIVGKICDRHGLTPERTVAYLCGHPDMTRNLKRLLGTRGFGAAQIRTEDYWPSRDR